MNDKQTTKTLGESMSQGKESKGQDKFDKDFKFSKKGKGKGKRKGGKRSINRGKMFNDVSFYMKNPSIAEAFAKIPFNYIIGNKPTGLVDVSIALPTVASYGIDWAASPSNISEGISGATIKDILNEVATIIYTTLRRHNAGSNNGIEYVDVITSNLIAGIDILCNAVNMQRTFKIANSFSWKNRMIPRVLFQHLGLNYDDFIANQANYRGQLNTLVAEARTIKVLSSFPFVNAILAEFSQVFKDSDTDTGREQIMIGCKYFHHIYDPVGTDAHPGGRVRLMQLRDLNPNLPDNQSVISTKPTLPLQSGIIDTTTAPVLRKFSVDLNILKTQIEALITDSDFNLIQADLEKAFGEQGGYVVADSISSDDTITPVYSGEVWSMIHNGVFIPDIDGMASYEAEELKGLSYLPPHHYENTVYQIHDTATGATKLGYQLHAVPMGIASASASPSPTMGMCDTESDNPDVSEIMIMTRFKSIYTKSDKSNLPAEFRPTGSTVNYVLVPKAQSNFILFGGMITHALFGQSSLQLTVFWRKWENLWFISSSQGLERQLPLLGFEHRPLAYGILEVGTGSTPNPILSMMNDVNNLRELSVDELYHIHQTAFLSLWNLPEHTNI